MFWRVIILQFFFKCMWTEGGNIRKISEGEVEESKLEIGIQDNTLS